MSPSLPSPEEIKNTFIFFAMDEFSARPVQIVLVVVFLRDVIYSVVISDVVTAM